MCGYFWKPKGLRDQKTILGNVDIEKFDVGAACSKAGRERKMPKQYLSQHLMRGAGLVRLRSALWRARSKKVTFEVPPSVVMKTAVFWDMTPCSILKFC